LPRPIEGDFISLHFLFTAGRFNREIRFDPQTYFFGDEVVVSLRAYSSGYEIFHPHVILGWHCYDRASRVPHWQDHRDWHQVHQRSLVRIGRLFRGAHRGRYGIGSRRTVREYEDRILRSLVEGASG